MKMYIYSSVTISMVTYFLSFDSHIRPRGIDQRCVILWCLQTASSKWHFK